MEREVKSARDLRVFLAEFDVPPSLFAAETGMSRVRVSQLLHGREPLALSTRQRIAPVLMRISAGEIVPDRTREGIAEASARAERRAEPNIRRL